MLIGEGRVPFDTLVPFIPRPLSTSDVYPAKIQNGGTAVVVERNARLLFGIRVSFTLLHFYTFYFFFFLQQNNLDYVVNSDDDDTPILAAVATHMRCNLHRNKGFMKIFCLHIRSMNL